MVNKVELGTLTQVSNNEHNFLKALNQNFTALQKAINDTLSRSGVTPNEMNEVLDMNGKRVINIGRAVEATDAVTKQDIQDIIDRAEQAIAGVDQIIVAAKAAVEAYAQEYIYPVAQAALDGAVAAKNAAEAARDALLNDEGYQKLIQNLDELVELADHAEELQAIVDNIDELLAVAEDIEAIKSVAENLSGLKSIVDNMQEILQASTYASQAAASASSASTSASTATSAASTATSKASEASASATSAAGSATTATTKASEAAASATQADAAVTAAGTSAQQASTSATHALIWAEGDDEAVEALGGEHSAKGWAEEAAQTVEGKQDKLTAGANIQISADNVISATDTTYTAGTGIEINNGVISATGGDIETYNSLSEAQRTTILSTGKYHNVDVASGTIFETYQGKFEQFSKVQTGTGYGSITSLNKNILDVAYGNGVYVGVLGYSQDVVVSTDGINWTTKASVLGDLQTWHTIKFFKNAFYAFYDGKYGYYSTDGNSWSMFAHGASNVKDPHAVACTNSLMVILPRGGSGQAGYARKSSDGTTWSNAGLYYNNKGCITTDGTYFYISSNYSGSSPVYISNEAVSNWTAFGTAIHQTGSMQLACGNGMLIVAGGSSMFYTPIDSVSWISSGAASMISALEFDGTNFALTSKNGAGDCIKQISATGSSWTQAATPFGTSNATNIKTAGGIQYYGRGSGNVAYYSQLEPVYSYALTPLSYNKSQVDTALAAKQGTLTAGANINIEQDGTISATDTTYTAGTGIEINNGVISATGGDVETFNSLSEAQRTTILSTGKYHNVDVVNGTIFETYQGKFEQFVKTPTGSTLAWNNITTSSAHWHEIVYGDNKFLAIAYGTNTALSSTDGSTWASVTLPSSDNWYGLTYGGGKYVAVAADSKKAIYSSDGVTWNTATIPTSASWQRVAYGNGKYVAIASNSYVAASSDGINWSTAMFFLGNAFDIAFGNGVFVAVSYTGSRIAYSTNGLDWTIVSSGTSSSFDSVAYGNGMFVAAGNNCVVYSTDGSSWTSVSLPNYGAWERITYGNGTFVAVCGDKYMYSVDGTTWTKGTLPSTQSWYGLAYGADKFIAVANSAADFAVGTATTVYSYSLTDKSYNKTQVDTALATKQGTLTAGANITIDDNNVISATGGGSAPTYDPATQELTF